MASAALGGESGAGKRARSYGADPSPAEPELAQCLIFSLGGESYAAYVLQIREIVEVEPLSKVPSTPPWIRGVMNLRGSVVPVVDLAIKFGQAETPVSRRTCIVIAEVDLEGRQSAMGVIVDSVDQVVDLGDGDVKPPPAFGTRVRVDLLLGMAALADRFVPILDLDRVLSFDELLTAAAISEEAGSAETDQAARADQEGEGA